MENKTISDLKSKMWYRLLKVIFIVAFFIVLVIGNLVFFNDSVSRDNHLDLSYNAFLKAKTGINTYGPTEVNFNFSNFIKLFFIGNFIILLIFEAIKRSFYYVVFGSLKPEK